jgi:hypothetical protein
MKNLGRYEIQSYDVLVKGVTQSREKILYYNNNNEDFFVERSNGTIREGYEQFEIIFSQLRWFDIKTNVVGQSFYVSDRGLPPTPYVYFTISDVDSIQRENSKLLKVIDSTNNPIKLEFETEYDCNQAYSLIILLLEDPEADTNKIQVDNIVPVIHFNKLFYNIDVLDNSFNIGTFSSDTSSSLILNINVNSFTSTLPITKQDIITKLVNRVSDNRDVVITIMEKDIKFHTGSINGPEVTNISSIGNYFIKIELTDLGQNTTQFTILLNII